MHDYLLRVGLGAGLNLLFVAPLLLLAIATSNKPKLLPVLLFAVFLTLDIAFVFLFKVVLVIPAWGGFNWQGKALEIAWPLLLAACVARYPATRIGLLFRSEPRSWRALLIVCVLYAVVMIPLLIYLSGGHLNPSKDLPTYIYEGTMPGLAEEFVYRGVFLMLLNEAFGRPWKVAGIQLGWGFVIVTALFGTLHGIDARSPGSIHIYWSGMIFPAITGVILAWLRERSGSVWPGAVFHNFVNVLNNLIG